MANSPKKFTSIVRDLKNLVIWVLIALMIRWQVIEPRWIPSGSMLPTLQIQDKILIEKLTPKINKKNNFSNLRKNHTPMLNPMHMAKIIAYSQLAFLVWLNL